MDKLTGLRDELRVPKNQFNNFGNYKYRSQEDILETVKPLLTMYGLLLTISDEMIMLGDRYYIKAVAKITDGEKEVISTGYAREPQAQKGMNEAQITGSASSYARKYALNALFLIDDTKDADTNEHQNQSKKQEQKEPATKQEPAFNRNTAIKYIDGLMHKFNYSNEQAIAIQKKYTAAKTRADFIVIQKQVEGE